MRMLWIGTIAVVLFATVSHANRVNASHPNADALTAPTVIRAPIAFELPIQLPQSSRSIGESSALSAAL